MTTAATCTAHSWRHFRSWTTTEVVTLDPLGGYTTREVQWDEWYCVNCRTFNSVERGERS